MSDLRVLVIVHNIPSPFFSDTAAIFHLVKHLVNEYKYDIEVIAFRTENLRREDLEQFDNLGVKLLQALDRPNESGKIGLTFYKDVFLAIKNNIRNVPKNIRHGLFVNLLDYYYSSEMENTINKVVNRGQFDMILTTRPMSNYVVDMPIPKFIHPLDAVYDWHRQHYILYSGLKKGLAGILYVLTKQYEKRIYKHFDSCLVVTDRDKFLLEQLNKEIKCDVLQSGVDTEYFSPWRHITEDYPSLVFLSNMGGYPAEVNVNSFYNHVFPIIREHIPDVRLILVGRSPTKNIINLGLDPAVTVTGFVDDVRPYLARASIVIAPLMLGTGIKLKMLEAMSMGKAIVTTSIGAQGIMAVNGKHFIICDKPEDFAREVISLLHSEELRRYIGDNAREIIEENYSWAMISGKLNDMLMAVVQSR
jgi:glycosyltransferase involved in cell wall biosynthesis